MIFIAFNFVLSTNGDTTTTYHIWEKKVGDQIDENELNSSVNICRDTDVFNPKESQKFLIKML